MKLKEIYELFERTGCVTLNTVSGGEPHPRIIHLNGCDDEGIYFRTMISKPFYRHLMENPSLSLCGIYPNGMAQLDEESGSPYFEPGYFIRLIGEARTVSPDVITEKGKTDLRFKTAAHDLTAYPAMINFVIHRARGEVFDYDFEKQGRDHKILRTRFSFGGEEPTVAGCRITDKCTACGKCRKNCTFKAIEKRGDRYQIIPERCDACGTCFKGCPVQAIEPANNL